MTRKVTGALQAIRRRLGIKMALSASLLAVTPLLVLSTVLAMRARSVMADQVHGILIAEAQGFATAVDQTLHERESNLRSLAADSTPVGDLASATHERSRGVLNAYQFSYPAFKGLLLLDAAGLAVAASKPELLRDARGAGSFRDRPWFQAAARGEQAVLVPEGEDAFFGGEVLLLSTPVVGGDKDKRTVGVLAAVYDWSEVGQTALPATQRAQVRGQQTLTLVIVDQHGHAIFSSTGESPPPLEELGVQPGESTGAGVTGGRVVAWAANQSKVQDSVSSWIFAATLHEDEAYGLIRSLLVATACGAAILILVAVTLAFWVARRLIEPIRALQQTVTSIIRDRDLTQPVPVISGDEIGELAGAFAEMVKRLREMLHRLRLSAFAFSSAAQALHAATDEQKMAFTRQAFTLEEANTTAREIKQTSMLAAKKAESMLEQAQRADEVGKQGEASLAATLGGLGEIRGQVTTIAAQIGKLAERTQQIGTITRTVKDLADQSNMLALNAAIEAVRSGEHGKGFSIVAREIRNLADQSIRATERVKEILDDTARAIRAAAQTTDRGTERMEQELVQVRGSGETLRQLSGILQDSGEVVRQIAASVQQQDAGFAQIFVAIADLSTLMDESLQRLSTTEEAARLVRETSEEVSQVASAYRV